MTKRNRKSIAVHCTPALGDAIDAKIAQLKTTASLGATLSRNGWLVALIKRELGLDDLPDTAELRERLARARRNEQERVERHGKCD